MPTLSPSTKSVFQNSERTKITSTRDVGHGTYLSKRAILLSLSNGCGLKS
jgi:hypothetical protein